MQASSEAVTKRKKNELSHKLCCVNECGNVANETNKTPKKSGKIRKMKKKKSPQKEKGPSEARCNKKKEIRKK